jgi:magnesium-transporting ATPase (P-type)
MQKTEDNLWYQLLPQDVLDRFNSDLQTGLSSDEAVKRSIIYGANELVEKGGRKPCSSYGSSSPLRWY